MKLEAFITLIREVLLREMLIAIFAIITSEKNNFQIKIILVPSCCIKTKILQLLKSEYMIFSKAVKFRWNSRHIS